jgi:hypothetical protein
VIGVPSKLIVIRKVGGEYVARTRFKQRGEGRAAEVVLFSFFYFISGNWMDNVHYDKLT